MTSQLAGMLALAAMLPFLPGDPIGADLVWGAVGGLGGSAGLVLFFAGMRRGPISLVSPIAAVTTAILPFTYGVITGDRPGPFALLGVTVGLAAIGMTGAGTAESRASGRVWLPFSLGAGVGFGGFFIAISRTGDDAGLWPLLGARGTVVGLALVAWIVARQRIVPEDPRATRTAVVSGVLDMAANALFLLAVRRGVLSLTSVLASLYPVMTVILAHIVLGERLLRHQRAAVLLAVGAAALIAAG